VSSNPTDFNDQAREQGAEALATLLCADLQDIDADRTANAEQAQPVEGGKPDSEQSPDGSSAPANAARGLSADAIDDDYDWQQDPAVPQFERNQSGQPKSSVRNTELVLRFDQQWRGVLGYCQLSYRIMKLKAPPMPHSQTGEWCDEDAAALRVWMSHQYGFTPTHGDINDALVVVARAHGFHPVRDYLEPLRWDGKERLPIWLREAFRSIDDVRYLEIVGMRALIGAVARVYQPGCKMDNVVILEGEQGRYKSTTIGALFNPWFSDSPLPIGDKEAYQLIQGKWCFELGELDSFNKAEVTQLKQFFSQQIDRFRPSYGRYAQDFPRQTVFWGSTNQDVYLRDYTGNRRFWPVYCVDVNRQWVLDHRDQLWAEALHRYRAGEKFWVSRETPEDEEDYAIVTETQDARLQRDPWEDLLRPFLQNTTRPWLTATEILQDCIKIDGAHMQPTHMNRLGPILRALGWRSVRKRIPTGTGDKTEQRRVWEPVDIEKTLEDIPF